MKQSEYRHIRSLENRKKVLKAIAKKPEWTRSGDVSKAVSMSTRTFARHLKALETDGAIIRRQESRKEVYYQRVEGTDLELALIDVINTAHGMLSTPIKRAAEMSEPIGSERDLKTILGEIAVFEKQSKILNMCIKKLFDIYCEISSLEGSRGADLDKELLFIHPFGERVEEFYVSYLDFIGGGIISIDEEALPMYLEKGFEVVEGKRPTDEGQINVRRGAQ